MRKQQLKKLIKLIIVNGNRREKEFGSDLCLLLAGSNVLDNARVILGVIPKEEFAEFPISIFSPSEWKKWKGSVK